MKRKKCFQIFSCTNKKHNICVMRGIWCLTKGTQAALVELELTELGANALWT